MDGRPEIPDHDSPAGRHLVRTFAAIAAVCVVLAATGCSSTGVQAQSSSAPSGGSTATPSGGSTATPATITIATPTTPGAPSGVPVWIGAKNGFFAAENLTVKVVTFPGQPAQAVAAVVAGKADLVISAPDALIVPTAKGTDLGLKWIFTPYQAPTFTIAVPTGSPIKTMKDLAGKTVAMPSTGAPFQTFMNTNIKGEGGDPTGVKVVTLGTVTALESMNQGKVDAVVTSKGDLALTVAAAGYKTTQLPLAPNVQKLFGAGFMMRTDATQAQRDVYARYLRAYLESAIFAQANPKSAIAMNWALYPQSKPTNVSQDAAMTSASASLTATVDDFVPSAKGVWGEITKDRWNAYIANLGLTAKLADPTVLYDDSLLAKIGDFDAAKVKSDAASK